VQSAEGITVSLRSHLCLNVLGTLSRVRGIIRIFRVTPNTQYCHYETASSLSLQYLFYFVFYFKIQLYFAKKEYHFSKKHAVRSALHKKSCTIYGKKTTESKLDVLQLRTPTSQLHSNPRMLVPGFYYCFAGISSSTKSWPVELLMPAKYTK
jgi:hypothetical protein